MFILVWFICCIQDEHIDRFMNLYTSVQEQKLPARMNEMGFENELKRSIMDINNAKGENLVQFLPLILDKLISLMVRPPLIGGTIGKLLVEITF